MMRALFTATSGMIVQERKQANVMNNLANVQTVGFKVEDLITKEVQQSTLQNRERLETGESYMREIGKIGFGTQIDKLFVDFEQGMLEETHRNTDFAIDGEGFFKIQWNENEIGYTRNGEFQVDLNGYLCTLEGKRVLGREDQPIRIGSNEFVVEEDGRILVDGIQRNQFQIVTFDTIEELNPLGQSVYSIENGIEVDVNNTKILQKHLEKSNVNPLEEMVKMIEISRTYESNQRIIQSLDRVLEKSVNQVGRV
ncbi:MAG: flagellar basal-body rod protein FlgF [Peptostreptococcales bacterium]